MQFIPPDAGLERDQPFIKNGLRLGTESPFLGIIVGGWQQPIQALEYGPCRLFGGCVRPPIHQLEFPLHVGPYRQAKALQQAIVARAAVHSLAHIALHLARLNAAQHRHADTGHIAMPAPDSINGVTLVAVVAGQVETACAFLSLAIHAA